MGTTSKAAKMTNTIHFNRLDPSVYSKIARTNLRTDMASRAAYTSDASIFRRVPSAILEPHNVDEIRDGLDIAKAKGWKVVGRGGGTSVAGNAIGEGLIIDTSRYFNRILDIDVAKRTATIEPGVVADALRDAALPHGLTYGPIPPRTRAAPWAAWWPTMPVAPTRWLLVRLRRTSWTSRSCWPMAER